MRLLLTAMNSPRTGDVVALLHAQHFILDHADTAREALHLVRAFGFDAAVIDATAGATAGATDCAAMLRELRAAGCRLPVVAVARQLAARDRARLLDLGADDVITLPVDGAELSARLRAVVRRAGGFAQSLLRVGPVELHLDRRDATAHGQDLHLTPTEYRALSLLLLRKNQLVSRQALMDALYGELDEPSVKSIDVLMHRLRKRLAAAGVGMLVTTVWGSGYIVREPAPDQRPARRAAARPVALALH